MKEKTNYRKYRVIQTYDEFFDVWDNTQLENITQEMRKRIYDNYVVKALVFQRDNFKCQNADCKYPESPLTRHHIKFQKNNGKNTIKNSVTICRTCHQGYHKGKNHLTFWGATYKLHQNTDINWKKVRIETKQIRKENMRFYGAKVSWEMIALLLKWLNVSYEDFEDEDD